MHHSSISVYTYESLSTPKTELRWLGLWLDPKLGFGPHIQRMQQRGKTTLAQMGRINRCYWGLKPKEAKVLIMTILKPRILFGCIAWFNTRTEGKVTRIFNLLQNAANRLILGAFKSSPAELMMHDTDMPTFKDQAIRYNHKFVYKRLTAPRVHPTRRILDNEIFKTPQKLLSPIHRLLRQDDLFSFVNRKLETIHPYPDPPWNGPMWEITNIGEKRETVTGKVPHQMEEEKRKGACVIFTDGSHIPDVGGGAAAAMEEGTIKLNYGPVEGISNFETEAMALMLGIVRFTALLTDYPDKYESLAIFSDSQAALELLANPAQPRSLQYIAKLLRKAYGTIPIGKTMNLYWTPGHEGITLNEEADKAAKEAAEGEADNVDLPVSLGGLLRHAKTQFKRRACSIKNFRTKNRYIADALNTLEKGQAGAIFQLRSGHCPLRKFLFRIGAEEDDKCDFCRVVESPHHFLIFCRNYTSQRQQFRKRLKEEDINVNINSSNKLLDTPAVFPHLAKYIEETGRFIHLKTYLEK